MCANSPDEILERGVDGRRVGLLPAQPGRFLEHVHIKHKIRTLHTHSMRTTPVDIKPGDAVAVDLRRADHAAEVVDGGSDALLQRHLGTTAVVGPGSSLPQRNFRASALARAAFSHSSSVGRRLPAQAQNAWLEG